MKSVGLFQWPFWPVGVTTQWKHRWRLIHSLEGISFKKEEEEEEEEGNLVRGPRNPKGQVLNWQRHTCSSLLANSDTTLSVLGEDGRPSAFSQQLGLQPCMSGIKLPLCPEKGGV